MIGPARRLAIAVVLACVIAGGAEARQAGGIEQFVGRPVVEVRFEVEGAVQTSAVFAANVQVRAGQALRLEDIRESIVRLSLRFEEVAVLAEEAPQGVRVVFRLTPRHPINRVAFGFTAPIDISVPDLESDFRRQFGGLPTAARIGAAEETVRRLMVDQGFIDVQVSSSTITTHNPDRATLIFAVTPGQLARVGSVDVRLTGSSPITREAILARSGVVVGGPYRRRALQTAMVGLQDDLRQQGYYEAIAASSDDRPIGRDDLNVTLVVDSGRRVDVVFQGDSLPSSVGRVEDLVPVKRLGSVDLSLLEDAQRNVEARLRNAGYKDAKVTFAESVGAAGTRVITFTFVRGPRYRIDRVVVPANLSIPAAQITERLDLPPGAPFSEARITAGVTRLIVDYQQLGYARAAVTPVYTAVEQTRGDDARVTVSLVVEEGPRHQVASIQVERPAGASTGGPDDLAVIGLMGLHRGGPYVAEVLRQDRITVEDHLRGLGFRSATVDIAAPVFSEQNGAVGVAVVVRVDAGVQVMVGSIVVVGNQQVDESAIREEITLREGQPFGEDARIESINRLTQMGVFGTVRIDEEARLRGEPDAAVVVSVTELPRTTMGVGGGLEVSRRSRSDAEGVSRDVLDAAPRGFFEIGRRGLGGRNRSINLFTRVAIKQANLGEDDDPATDGGYGFSEYRLTGTYRERRAFRTDTELLFGLTAEQAIRTNFDFRRQSANAEVLRHITPTLNLVGRYVLDRTELFNEQIPPEDQFEIDRLFPQLRLSFFGGGVSWDRRNSLFAPSLGTLLSGDFEVAARMLGSEVGYVKTFLQASAQRPFDDARRTVVAVRGQVGMARGFEQTVATVNEDGEPVLGPDGEVILETVADIPASQRFFGGGGTTVRGFQLDHLGAQEVLTSEGLSNGGNGLLIFNLEVRRIVKQVFGRNMAAVAFVDAGNVFRRVRDVNLKELRSAVGLGVRYDSPIGPLRFDVGFKTTRLVFGNRTRERGWEYHLSIGEAF